MSETTAAAVKTEKKNAKGSKADKAPKLSGVRVKLLTTLGSQAFSIEELTKKTGMARRAVYHHLWHLRQDGFVRSKSIDVDGAAELVFESLAKGRKAAQKAG